MSRRSNFIHPHSNPTALDALAAEAMDNLDELAAVIDHIEEVPC